MAKCSGEHPSCKRCTTRRLVSEYAKEGRVRGPNKPKPKPPPPADSASTSSGATTQSSHAANDDGKEAASTRRQTLYERPVKREQLELEQEGQPARMRRDVGTVHPGMHEACVYPATRSSGGNLIPGPVPALVAFDIILHHSSLHQASFQLFNKRLSLCSVIFTVFFSVLEVDEGEEGFWVLRDATRTSRFGGGADVAVLSAASTLGWKRRVSPTSYCASRLFGWLSHRTSESGVAEVIGFRIWIEESRVLRPTPPTLAAPPSASPSARVCVCVCVCGCGGLRRANRLTHDVNGAVPRTTACSRGGGREERAQQQSERERRVGVGVQPTIRRLLDVRSRALPASLSLASSGGSFPLSATSSLMQGQHPAQGPHPQAHVYAGGGEMHELATGMAGVGTGADGGVGMEAYQHHHQKQQQLQLQQHVQRQPPHPHVQPQHHRVSPAAAGGNGRTAALPDAP
ncbi:hypothetical protein LshimejAT787_1105190 [Lyophyllum shimeji]|uniref:Uncharacterized protein n=1 Tax=Lyophyllum shimeji TaxID=47721 RepID=A0A9P3UP97_LYOSH|nr:hypothetical protein LshimejAT787_1105190 [Lyophyllum shimeji]